MVSGEEFAYQCRRHRFDPWSRKIPQAVEKLHLLSLCSRAQEPHLLKPMGPRFQALQQEKPPR